MIDVSKLPELPAGLYYEVYDRSGGCEVGAQYVWVRWAGRDRAIWCIDEYLDNDNKRAWRVERTDTGWNRAFQGMCNYATVEEACTAMRNYTVVMIDLNTFEFKES